MVQNLFVKKKIPVNLSKDIKLAVRQVKDTKDQKQALKIAYDIVTKRFYGHRLLTFAHITKGIRTDVNRIWETGGCYQCTTQNYLLRLLLVNSGWIKDTYIKQKVSLIWYIGMHQYLELTTDDGDCVYLDPWSKIYGVGFGYYAHGFKSGSIFKRR